MSTLRDKEILIQQTKKTPTPHLPSMTVDLSAQDCQFYGHSWQAADIAGAKYCIVCGITGYCPGCTPIPSINTAHPFYCTKHTPRHESLEEEVQL